MPPYQERLDDLDRTSRNSEETVRKLMKMGADVNATNNDGKKPVDVAKENGHDNLVEILRAYE